jgi:hypothetical protein
VTLIRIALGFLAVAALFVGYAWTTGQRERGSAVVLSAEALVLTLFAALWFGSLGKGGWLLVFLLTGLLASGVERWIGAVSKGAPLTPLLRPTLLTTIRYAIAGGVLAVILA